jgi:phosphoribosyl 1,2-cyclic phosphodiesterase
VRFTVLASGSAGNASLVQGDNFGFLIDIGLGPKQMAERLGKIGQSWSAVRAVVLTHTHSDHWKDATLSFLLRRHIPLYCHTGHQAVLQRHGSAFTAMQDAGLMRSFEAGEELLLSQGMRCRPLPVRHDSGPTFGFRVEGPPDLFGRATAIAYAADLGCWDEELVDQMADVDLLALEFNHDVTLERASGRAAHLIRRVLGDEGHLSNDQAAELVKAVIGRSPGRLRHLVQLHLSHDCNRQHLARKAARAALTEMASAARVHTAAQAKPTATLALVAPRKRGATGARRTTTNSVAEADQGFTSLRLPVQQWLPGLGQEEIA